MAKKTVMKMMAVRALRPLRPVLGFDLADQPASEFRSAIQNAASLNAVVERASQFVKSAAYIPNAKNSIVIELLKECGRLMAQSGDVIDAAPAVAYIQRLPAAQKKMLQDDEKALMAALADSFVAACYAPAVDETQRQDLQAALRAIGTLMAAGSAKNRLPRAMLTAPVILPPPAAWQPGAAFGPAPNPIRPAGIGDLLVVREEMLGYERTQIAHVENVMASEKRDRLHRRLDRLTETTVSETESVQQASRDLHSSQRSEMSQEISRNVSEAMSLAAGLQVSARYGPVLSINATTDFAYDTAREEASSSASGFAQEVIDRSVSNLSERRLSSHTRTVLSETEESNSHGFDNTAGAQHIVGVYRWLDQRWRAQVMNYGRRLLMEFNVPQPAHAWHAAKQMEWQSEVYAEMPTPLPFTLQPAALTESNYLSEGARFGAGDLPPPPPATTNIDTAIQLPETYVGKIRGDEYNIKMHVGSVPVPDGYLATAVRVDAQSTRFLKDNNNKPSLLTVIVGNQVVNAINGSGAGAIDNIADTVDIAVYAYDLAAAVLSLRLTLTRTPAHYQQWQLACWSKMKEASDRAWAAYRAAVASRQNVQDAIRADTHPDAKRRIERTELKRGALELLTQQHFDDFDPLVQTGAHIVVKNIDVPAALADGRIVSFFEQAFEWEQMTYLFYPYFWGNRTQWRQMLNLTDPDPGFAAFLAAGSSRVQVPVRPGFERAVAYFLATGRLWMGRDAPVMGSPLYLPIVEEIAEAKDASLDKAQPYGEPWEYTVPTNLVVLDPDASAIPAAVPPA